MNNHSEKYDDCDIVLDLLPLYLEGKTGRESNEFVKKHLEECGECKEAYGFMSTDYLHREVFKEDKISKNRVRLTYRNKRRLLLMVALLGYLCLMTGIVIYTFLYLTF